MNPCASSDVEALTSAACSCPACSAEREAYDADRYPRERLGAAWSRRAAVCLVVWLVALEASLVLLLRVGGR